jgi:Protein kinase domain
LLTDLRDPVSADTVDPQEARQAVALVERLTPAGPAGTAAAREVGGPIEGDRLGPYQLLKLLGKGGMGQVFQARDTLLGRTVAVKVIAARYLGDAAAVARFRQEMQAQARLNHPHIALAYHADQVGDTLYLAMEYVDGVTLADLVRERGPLPVAEACAYAAQVADALAYIHRLGLAHRDIKPNNLIRANRPPGGPGAGPGPVKVLDFGLARLREASPAAGPLTATGEILGTPEFMAPEQWQDTRATDVRSDLYSLGCTLFYLLTGSAPFPLTHYPTLQQMWYAHAKEPVPSVREVRPDVPEALAEVLRRLLAKEPAGRHATPAEARTALAAFAGPADPGGPPAEREPPPVCSAAPAVTSMPGRTLSPAPGPRQARRGRWLLAGSLAGLLLLGLAGWQWGWPALHPSRLPRRAPGDTPDQPVAARPVEIVSFQVQHYRGDPPVLLGDLGALSTRTLADDDVKVRAQLSRPGYFYLLAFLPNGKAEPCFPKDPGAAPPPLAGLVYPPGENVLYGLTDGVGLEAFALFVSAEPLPPFDEWRRANPVPAWKTVAAGEVVWWGDEEGIRPRGKQDRGERAKLGPPPEVAALYRFFRERPGAAALRLVAFPVAEKR